MPVNILEKGTLYTAMSKSKSNTKKKKKKYRKLICKWVKNSNNIFTKKDISIGRI